MTRELIRPLKKGLGNAEKWRNRKDPAKRITVEAVVTGTGALIAVSDEGEGFDAQDALAKLHAGERYFTRRGGGFRRLMRMKSLTSYYNGGRTLLIRFLYA